MTKNVSETAEQLKTGARTSMNMSKHKETMAYTEKYYKEVVTKTTAALCFIFFSPSKV